TDERDLSFWSIVTAAHEMALREGMFTPRLCGLDLAKLTEFGRATRYSSGDLSPIKLPLLN
ncbi:MAG: hypothetical protein ABI656_12945, partial [bacterium]